MPRAIAVVFPVLLLAAAIVIDLAGRGRIRRNPITGIRTPATMTSDEAWVAGDHAATGVAWIGFLVSAVAGAEAFLTSGTPSSTGVVIVIIVFVATVVIALVRAMRAAARV
ncbi:MULTISPECIES: SdpI family protein [unclassified Microbacterium]|uniref:SdpI family protein n=1 Tax=unclassified Microbacterium TaxID=2609290 RepID=UPI00364BC827